MGLLEKKIVLEKQFQQMKKLFLNFTPPLHGSKPRMISLKESTPLAATNVCICHW